MNQHDREHIWLKQTVTFTVDGQTRTLEIGIPLPPDATPRDVQRLLGAAESGMRAITQRLDAHVAAAMNGDVMSLAPAPHGEPPASGATSPATPSVNGRAASGNAPPARSAESAPPVQPTPPMSPIAPPREPPREPRATAHPPDEAPRRQMPPTSPAPSTPAARTQSAATGATVEMTRPQFIAAAAELGLNPRQAMDQLGVRSLEGLNLREALESLRRHMLGASASAGAEPEELAEPAPSTTTPIAPTAAEPRYFEEEDDETILYAEDDEDELVADDYAPSNDNNSAPMANADTPDEMEDELDLDEVPDLTPPPTTRRQSPPATRSAKASTREAAPADTAATGATGAASTGGARSQAMQIIGRLRAATGGGPASDYQRTAFRNIVEEELGKAQATALVRGLWRTTTDRLSAGQLDALIRWGKEEVFADEAAQVLATLRAEQRRAEQAGASSQDDTTRASSQPTSRGRSGGGPR